MPQFIEEADLIVEYCLVSSILVLDKIAYIPEFFIRDLLSTQPICFLADIVRYVGEIL